MSTFRHFRGKVYVLENPEAQRVKIGMTTNKVVDRLKSVNRMWLEHKVTCQICGGRRLVNNRGLMPKHVVSGHNCPGADSPPLESDVSLAEKHLEHLKKIYNKLPATQKRSTARIVKNLEKRIELYRHHGQPVGRWHTSVIFDTDCAEKVELLSHEVLADRLDTQALFGEVFCCSVEEANESIESVLSQLGLSHSAKKETRDYATSEKYGQCVICGNNLTETGACPECIRRLAIEQ